MKLKIIFFIGIGLTLLGLISYGLLNYPYSEGVRSGKLVKISKKGIFYPTYEGTLDLGSGDQLTWNFSVHSRDIGDELVKQSGKQVKLKYDELFFKLFYETKYNVKGFSYPVSKSNSLDFCELVNFIRSYPKISEVLKNELIKFKKDGLLNNLRNCQ